MVEVILVHDESAVIKNLADEIAKCAKSALRERGIFRVGLSGGSMLNYLCSVISKIEHDLDKWRFFFCDERFVPESHPESTCGAYKRELLPRCGGKLQTNQFTSINYDLSLDACARDYETKIMNEFKEDPKPECAQYVPQYDLLLLGMGPDGHTCSLFPGHVLLTDRERLVAPVADSPKPPSERITMTLPLINAAKCCLFAICGDAKAEMVKRVFADKETLPAALVAPHNGKLICICDEGAGKYLKFCREK